MAPMTRLRADDNHVPLDYMIEYYKQRAATPGTLLITESNFISARARGRDENPPGIFAEDQIQKWSHICDAVPQNKSYIFMQLWHVGRAARPDVLARAGLPMLSSSDIPISKEHQMPRPMTEREIENCIQDFVSASKNAINAGFNSVELHGANGYLIDQFTQDVCNQRTDTRGGTIQNRSRFCFEVVKAVCETIGTSRTTVRLSPFSNFQGMRMKDPVPQFTDLIGKLRVLGLAYLDLIEPRVSGNIDQDQIRYDDNLEFVQKVWNKAGPVILAGGYNLQRADDASRSFWRDDQIAFAFGRDFISNPDLPHRLIDGIPLTRYNRATFYKVKSPEGYIDYPTQPVLRTLRSAS